jgi:hypothetical protein
MPVSEVFYDDLDTVRFGSGVSAADRKARGITAMGTLMLGLLVGNAAPLLSQAQAFDGELILGLLGQPRDTEQRGDRLAILRLARQGYFRVGILDSEALRADPPDGERYTLINAFRSALGGAGFVFSGWPELADPELRPELLSCLDHAPDQLGSLAGSDVADRVEGLRELDRNLRQGSGQGALKVVRPVASQGLRERVRADLADGASGDPELANAAEWLLGEVDADRAGRFGSRSGWYSLLDQYKRTGGAVTTVRDIVDGHYNAIVAESMGAPGISLSCGDEEAACLLATHYGLSEGTGERAVNLVADPRRAGWLRWTQVPELLETLDDLSPDRRLDHLVREHSDFVGTYQSDNRLGVSLKVALPAGIVAGLAAFGAAPIAGPGIAAAAAQAAVTGAVTMVAAVPAFRRAGDRYRRRLTHREGEQWQSSIRTGSAAWPDAILRKPGRG